MTIRRQAKIENWATAAHPTQPYPGAGWQRAVPVEGTGAQRPTPTDFEFINENCDTACCATEILTDSGIMRSHFGSLVTPTSSPQVNVNPPAFRFSTASGDSIKRQTLGVPMF